MAQVYFLIPGLIAGPRARSALSDASIARIRKMFGRLSDDPVMQPLGTPASAECVHLSWLWSVLTRRPLPFAGAAYTWAVENGPMLSGDIWSFELCRKSENGTLERVSLAKDALEAACAALTPVLASAGFVLQRWDPSLYLTRKSALDAFAAPFDTVRAKPVSDTHIEGKERGILTGLIASCEQALANIELSDLTVWLSLGGGAFDYVYPPTKIRSVLSDSALVRGWALAAGILLQRIAPLTGSTDWPADAPQGARIAVLDDLWEPWMKENWAAWEAALEGVCGRVESLSAAARKRGCDEALVVGTGESIAVTLARRLASPASLFARFSGKEIDPRAVLFLENTP